MRLYMMLAFFFLAAAISGAFAQTEAPPNANEEKTIFYSDRFIFRGEDIDDLHMVLMAFERGGDSEKKYGEFFGAVFEKSQWSFFEGNDKYRFVETDLTVIQPSYYAAADGTASSGFILKYDAGDYTLKISSGPVRRIYTPNNGVTLKKTIGIAEAVLSIHGKKYWGDLIYESLLWNGFDGLMRYKHLYKEYQGFYLKSEAGKLIYFHQNKADQNAFKNTHHLPETLQSEGGVILQKDHIVHTFKSPIPITALKKKTPPLAFYKVPQRWQVDTSPEAGRLFLWSRGEASKNWVTGGYYVMAIEGIVKAGTQEERVWGFAEYYP
ncbi:MAG: hypothetical protein ACE5GK_06865 [Nitrospiria bacterium]